MIRLGLRTKLLSGMFLILLVSIGLVAGQAVLLFQEDKSSYVFDLNASQAIRIADEIQTNVRHLEEKMRIFSDAIVLEAPRGADKRKVLASMLSQYPEFLLFSVRSRDGGIRSVFQSKALKNAGVTVEILHAKYREVVPFNSIAREEPFLARLHRSQPRAREACSSWRKQRLATCWTQ